MRNRRNERDADEVATKTKLYDQYSEKTVQVYLLYLCLYYADLCPFVFLIVCSIAFVAARFVHLYRLLFNLLFQLADLNGKVHWLASVFRFPAVSR